MSYVLTLIAHNSNQLENNILELVKNYAFFTEINWLSENKALDIFFENDQICAKFSQLKLDLNAKKIDVILQSDDANRKKKLLLADMDGTLIKDECLDEIAGLLGIKNKVANITKRAMAGEIDFNTSLTERVSLLKGITIDKIKQVLEQLTIRDGAKELAKTMRANGATCILVSGGFDIFAKPITEKIGFNYYYSNIFGIEENMLTGKVIPPIVNETRKKEILELELKKLNLNRSTSIVIGDGANDIEMLKTAGLGVAFHASDKTKTATSHHINFANLKSILYIQGYSDADIFKASSI